MRKVRSAEDEVPNGQQPCEVAALTLRVRRVVRTWKNNRAERPKQLVGRKVFVTPRRGKKGKPFLIGRQFKGKVTSTGPLYLGIVPFRRNYQATGTFEVRIQATR